MWEAISQILTSANAIIVLIFIIVILVMLIVLGKAGLLSLNSKFIKFGMAQEKERRVIREQVEWAHLHCQSMEQNIPKLKDSNPWRSKYIIERIYDEVVSWITFNHLSADTEYIEIKQDKIVNLIHGLMSNQVYRDEKFVKYLRDNVKVMIEKLRAIRDLYT